MDNTPEPSVTGLPGGWPDSLLAARRAKNHFFAHSQHSPLPAEQRRSFTGLSYFAPDSRFRVEGVRIDPIDGGDAAPFLIDTSDGRPRAARRLGRLRFRLSERDLTLTAYQVGDDRSGSLFVPFRDLTSGEETYGAGRYLDIRRDVDGSVALDFNEAYHPYCAYVDTYSCPLPPRENSLPVRIAAGERLGPPSGPTDGRH